MSQEEKKILIENCIKGDRKSQEKLYKTYAHRMFGLCLRYTGNYHEAEDILQEGFVKVFLNLKQFRGDGSFESWMIRIFINTALQHLTPAIRLYSISEIVTDNEPFVDENIVADISADELLQILQQLSPGYRTVFNLYAIEGYSHKEIAEMLQIREGTSKSQLARARQQLKEKIKVSKKVSRYKEAYV